MSAKTAEQLIREIAALAKQDLTLSQRRQKRLLIEQLLALLPQGPGSGLNADKLDGMHADEIIKKARTLIGGGGGARAYELEDHSSGHHKGGSDPLGPTVVIRFGAEDFELAGAQANYVIPDSDICVNPSLFKFETKLYVKFIYHIKNDTPPEDCVVWVIRQSDGSTVTGSQKQTLTNDWECLETGWIDWSSESGCESYQLKVTNSGGTVEINCALMILCSHQPT